MTQPNPFAPFVARMDHLVPRLESGELDKDESRELVDLIRRAMYALVNHINSQATYMASLILDPTPEPDTDDAPGTSLEQQADPSAAARSDGQTPGTSPGDPQNPDSEVHGTT